MAAPSSLRNWTRIACGLVAATMLSACGGARLPQSQARPLSAAAAHSAMGETFTTGFLWGVATAGFQYEGGDTTSNWAAWIKSGHAKQPMGRAIDHWNRYAEDLDLAKGLGLNSFRLSLEWARIEPKQGQFDPAAIKHYHDVFAACRARGLEPVVTLSHFAYPAWLDGLDPEADTAWESDEMVTELTRYAGWAAKEYGPEVRWWLTLNEPNTLAICGYLAGMHAPGKHSPLTYQAVIEREAAAHRAMYAAVHAADADAMVSTNPIVLDRRGDGPRYRTEALSMPDEVGFLDRLTPVSQNGEAPSGPSTLDYVAFNYFYSTGVYDAYKLADYFAWPIYPEGMYVASKRLYARYHLPLMVAENGVALPNGQARADGWSREAFLVNHLAQLRRAMAEGVPVLGYMHWTLADNYEWGSWAPRFGLYAVDPDDLSLRRKKTPAAEVYQAIATQNRLPDVLLDRYLGRKN